METKLTIRLKKKVIERAKEYALLHDPYPTGSWLSQEYSKVTQKSPLDQKSGAY